MRAVYVTQKGASVRRRDKILEIWVQHKKETSIGVHDLEQLVLMGNVVLTPAAIDLLMHQGIDTVFLTYSGRYRGRLVCSGSSNVRLRLAQYKRLMDEQVTLDLSKKIVTGKLHNQRALLQRYLRRYESDENNEAIVSSIRALKATRSRLQLAKNVDEVRGCEGAGAAAYFRAFGAMIRAEGFHFSSRNRRPPMDPVNALLSLGYTLLFNLVEAMVHVVGLDPYLGTLHAPAAGRPSLACDLVEEFRAPIIDALVLAAINKGAITPSQFEDNGPGEPVTMQREAVTQLVTLFERRMDRQVLYEPLSNNLPFRKVVEQQVRRVARYILETDDYCAYQVR